MIKIGIPHVYGIEYAIEGMRNPLDSHDKADSEVSNWTGEFWMGKNDAKLASRLANAGDDHGKFLRFINVTVDVTAPLYFWKEFDQYKVGTTTNSESTMHCIMKKEFTEDMFSWEKMYLIDMKENILANLNFLRARYLQDKDKNDWYCLIQALPSSWNQKRAVNLNYQVLRHIYHARKNHKLDEWKEFCKMIEELDYADLLIVGKNVEDVKLAPKGRHEHAK